MFSTSFRLLSPLDHQLGLSTSLEERSPTLTNAQPLLWLLSSLFVVGHKNWLEIERLIHSRNWPEPWRKSPLAYPPGLPQLWGSLLRWDQGGCCLSCCYEDRRYVALLCIIVVLFISSFRPLHRILFVDLNLKLEEAKELSNVNARVVTNFIKAGINPKVGASVSLIDFGTNSSNNIIAIEWHIDVLLCFLFYFEVICSFLMYTIEISINESGAKSRLWAKPNMAITSRPPGQQHDCSLWREQQWVGVPHRLKRHCPSSAPSVGINPLPLFNLVLRAEGLKKIYPHTYYLAFGDFVTPLSKYIYFCFWSCDIIWLIWRYIVYTKIFNPPSPCIQKIILIRKIAKQSLFWTFFVSYSF